jgi:hypothetical protein
MKRLLKVAAAFLALGTSLLLGAPVARAQMSPDAMAQTYNTHMSGIISAAVSNATRNNILNGTARPNSKKGVGAGRASSGAASSGSTLAKSVGLPYAVTPALKQETVQGYVDRLKATNPAAAQALAANFGPGKHDYNAIYQQVVKGNGLHENDAADATVAYLVLGWMIVNNVQDGNAVTPAMVQGVRAQFAPRLSQSPQLTAPGAAAQLGEAMKLQFVVMQSGWAAAQSDGTLPAYQQRAAALFKTQYGLAFDELKLTSQGFTKR